MRLRIKTIALELLDWLMRSLSVAWELAWRNRRMTAKGIAGALVILAAHYGFDVSQETQATLAAAIALYIGLVGRDRKRRLR